MQNDNDDDAVDGTRRKMSAKKGTADVLGALNLRVRVDVAPK